MSVEPETESIDGPESEAHHSRRQVLRGVAISAAGLFGLSAIGFGGWNYMLAKDEDEEDDEDHSGSGRGGDEDHSGPGGGGDDEVIPITGEIPAGSIEIRIVDDDPGGFTPAELTVDLGQSVTFVNSHNDEHTATGSGFDTGIIQSGGTSTVVLDEPGRFAYACQIHPEMTGSIAVRDAEGEVPAQEESGAPAGTTNVRIVNFAFDPATISVPLGTTVAWSNDDAAPHTVTAVDGAFDSGIFDPGASFSFTFDAPGSFAYRCNLHPQMEGLVEVTGEAASPEASPAASVLTGAWVVTYESASSGGFASLGARLTINQDGTIEATYSEAADAESALGFVLGPATGVWTSEDGTQQMSTLTFLLDDGQRFAGTLTISEEIRIDESGEGYQGEFTYKVESADGTETSSGEGTCRGERISTEDEATPESGTPVAGTPAAGAVIVSMLDFSFDPPTVEVQAGTTVIWRNDGEAPHTATALDGGFDTGQLDPGHEGQLTFDQAGTFDYRCDFHPDMQGTVIVT